MYNNNQLFLDNIRYIQIPPDQVDVELLQDAARKENSSK
jgi:hypothetical protein